MTRQPDEFESIYREGFEAYGRYVNPVIHERARLAKEPIRLERVEEGHPIRQGEGALLDLHGVASFGQRPEPVVRALRAFLDSDRPHWFPSRVNPLAGTLAAELHTRTGYERAFFPCTGTEAVEAALKLARAATRRPRLLSLRGAYHGCTFGSCALMSPGPFRDAFGPHLPGVESLPFADLEALREAFDGSAERGEIAAVIAEPIQGEGGVRPLPEAYVEALCALTAERGALLIADEIQTGLGRGGGGLLLSARWPRRPDVALLGKALGGGMVPLSAMLTTAPLFERAYGRDFAVSESHNTTFHGHALGCVAALATLRELLTEELMAEVPRKGERLRAALRRALEGNPLFSEVRGEGLLVGVALRPIDHPWLSFEHFGLPELKDKTLSAPLLCHRLYQRGYYVFACGHRWDVVRIQPRLDVADAELEAFAAAVGEELAKLAEVA